MTGSPAYHAGDHVLVDGEPGVVQRVARIFGGQWLYEVETGLGSRACLGGDLAPMRSEREEVCALMRGTRDTQGLTGLDAVLTVVARDRTSEPDDLVRRALELLAYAWGFAHGMHSPDLPDNPGICAQHGEVMREGYADGWRALPWEMNPAPLPTVGEGS